MLRLVDESDLIILAFPLYVDSLHSQVIETLELIAEHQKNKREPGIKSFAAIANSGFPEVKQNNTALVVCRLFAKQVGFTWAGGLAMGGGGMISGLPLAELGGRVRNKVKALEIATDALAKGEPISDLLLCGTILFTWIYNNTGGNILAAMFFHTMNNLSFLIFPTLETTLGGLYLMILDVAYVAAVLIIWGLKRIAPCKPDWMD